MNETLNSLIKIKSNEINEKNDDTNDYKNNEMNKDSNLLLNNSPTEDFKKRKAEDQISKKEKRRLKTLNRDNHCIEFLPSKGRQCRQDKLTNSDYCLNHYMERKHAGTLSEREIALNVQDNVKQLINCPICGIAIKQMKYNFHIENCPKVKRQRFTQNQPFFVEHINGNVPKEMISLKDVKTEFASTEEFRTFVELVNKTFEMALNQANKSWNYTRDIYHLEQPISQFNDINNTNHTNDSIDNQITRSEDLIKIHNTNDSDAPIIQSHFPFHVESPDYLKDELSKTEQVAKNKHVFQQASIVGIVDRHKLLNNEVLIIDMGSGKGELSLTFAQTLKRKDILSKNENNKDIRIILVDRGVFRRRKDNSIRMEHPLINKSNIHLEQESIVKRLSIDIQDLDIGRVKELESKNAFCISKHLCGVATDLSLRCLENTNRDPLLNNPEKKHFNLQGYFICLCCHHACHWKEYINQEYWTNNLGLTENDFIKIKSASSWAVSEFRETVANSHEGYNNEVKDIFDILTNEEKKQLGWKCKRLIDFGRIDYLRKHNYDAYLLQYIDARISPECLILVAIPK